MLISKVWLNYIGFFNVFLSFFKAQQNAILLCGAQLIFLPLIKVFLLISSVIPGAIDSESILQLFGELDPNVRLESQLQVWKCSLVFLLANFYSIKCIKSNFSHSKILCNMVIWLVVDFLIMSLTNLGIGELNLYFCCTRVTVYNITLLLNPLFLCFVYISSAKGELF